MSSGESIETRYRRYRWGERYPFVRYLSLVLLILGAIFIILGSMVPVVLLSGRIMPDSALSTKIVLGILGLVFGLFLGILCMGLSRVLLLLKELEHHARYAMNVWLILEERDFRDEGGSDEDMVPEQGLEGEDTPRLGTGK